VIGIKRYNKVNQGLHRRGFSPSFQQNFESKEWVNGLGPRAGQTWPTFLKHVLFVTSPPEPPPPKPKIVFFDFDYKTCWIRRGFEQLSSSIAWRVIGLQSSTRKVAHAGLKGWPTPSESTAIYCVKETSFVCDTSHMVMFTAGAGLRTFAANPSNIWIALSKARMLTKVGWPICSRYLLYIGYLDTQAI